MKTWWSRPFVDYLPGLVLWLATIGYLGISFTYPADARALPVVVGCVLFVLLPLDLISISETRLGLAVRRLVKPPLAKLDATDPSDQPPTFWRQCGALACVFVFTGLLMVVGVLLAIPLYVAGSMRFFGRKSWRMSVITALIAGVFAYLLFVVALGIQLYPGLLFSPE